MSSAASPHAPSRREAWRSFGLRRVLALSLGLAAVAVGLAYLPRQIRHADNQVAAFGELSPQDRLLRGARGIDVDTRIYLLAQRVIPPGATYYVATGPGVQVSSPVTDEGIGSFGILFLAPRWPVQRIQDARYVVSYGADLKSLGVPIGRIWTAAPGMQVAEVRR
jgi:hypothetical protein